MNRTGWRWGWRAALLLALALGNGCLSLKSQHEVKPIHITMDINLKVDRELDRYFGVPEGEVKP